MTASELTDRVLERLPAEGGTVVDLCAALVAAPSSNPPGDTREVAGVVETALRERGLSPRLEQVEARMPSVLAEIDSGRPGPHLVLNVHLDTMPPGDEDAWSVPVWQLTRSAGRLYGLGMGNMKGAVAAMVHATGLLAELRRSWSGRITFLAVSDEVVFGDNGAAFLLRTHPELAGDALICGEGPGYRRLAIGEKGVLWVRIAAVGAAGHSSSVRAGASAAARIAEAVQRVDLLSGRCGSIPSELATLGLGEDPGIALTANVGTIRAGTFIGQIATTATAEVDVRLPPGIGCGEAEELVRTTVAGIDGVRVERIKGWDANWTSPTSRLVRCWDDAAVQVAGRPSDHAIRLPASDASRWRQRGVAAVCFGPQPTYSAGIDDYAEEDDVMRCAALYTATALRYLSS